MENHISLYKHENTWNKCGGVLNSEVAMSGAGEQAFTFKKMQATWYYVGKLRNLFNLLYLWFLQKNNSRKGLKFRRVKDHSIVWTKFLFCWTINFPIKKDNVALIFAKFKMARESV
jgi:hypothetical protein